MIQDFVLDFLEIQFKLHTVPSFNSFKAACLNSHIWLNKRHWRSFCPNI